MQMVVMKLLRQEEHDLVVPDSLRQLIYENYP